MSRTRRRRWILGALTLLLLTVIVVAASYRQSLFARDKKGPGPDDLDLRVGKTEIADVQIAVTEVGTIEPVVKVDVKSTLSGTVKAILVREGDRVRAGQTLARVDPDVNQAKTLSGVRSEVTKAQINLEKARKDLESNQSLFQEGYVAEDQMRNLKQQFETAQEQYNQAQTEFNITVQSGIPLDKDLSAAGTVNVVAPMDGYVIKKNIEVGQTVMSGMSSFNEGTAMFTVADISSMLIKASINEVEVGRVRLKQRVEVTVDAFPYKRFGGTVTHISPAARLKDKVKVFDIEVSLDEQNPDFRAGMTANIEVKGDKVEKALSVPIEAIFRRASGEAVYVLKETFDDPKPGEKPAKRNGAGKIDVSESWQRYFEERPVKVGLASLERVQVLEGLTDGLKIALEDPSKPRQISQD